jgi:Fur family ferric uptake transcriptional regulator
MESEVVQLIQEHGLRITRPRRLIVRAVLVQAGPFSAEELLQQLQQDGQATGRATVFRTLDLLVALGVLRRVHHPSGLHRYVLAGFGHGHHVVCSRCGAVADFNGCNVDDLIAEVVAQTGFRVDGHWLELFGLCMTCQKGVSSPGTPVAAG